MPGLWTRTVSTSGEESAADRSRSYWAQADGIGDESAGLFVPEVRKDL